MVAQHWVVVIDVLTPAVQHLYQHAVNLDSEKKVALTPGELLTLSMEILYPRLSLIGVKRSKQIDISLYPRAVQGPFQIKCDGRRVPQ
jgi:hypothetical protein